MSRQFRRATFKRAMAPDAQMEEADGWANDLFGIARQPGRWGRYEVTHLPTGYRMGLWVFGSLAEAQRFCRLVRPLTDWQTIPGSTKASPMFQALGRAIREVWPGPTEVLI